MNKERRKRLSKLLEAMAAAEEELSAIIEEEQAAFDNMPESIQGGEQGAAMEEGIGKLEDCLDSIQDIQAQMEEVAEG